MFLNFDGMSMSCRFLGLILQIVRLCKSEEAEIYHWTNMEDTRIMMENGLEAEGIDRTMERTNDEEEDLKGTYKI